MYPLGFLFSLGFETATEIGVLGISATQAANGVSLSSIMVFPAIFTAGMALVDSTDSVLMVGAYGWAFINPIRKLWYNITITAISVVVALFIGSLEALGLIADKLGLENGLWKVVADLNENLANFGFARNWHFHRELASVGSHLPGASMRMMNLVRAVSERCGAGIRFCFMPAADVSGPR